MVTDIYSADKSLRLRELPKRPRDTEPVSAELGLNLGPPRWHTIKNQPSHAGDARELGSIPGSGRSAGGGHGNPLQYSCLENSMDRGAWQAIVHGVAKIPTHLSDSTHTVSLVPTDCHSPDRRRDCAHLGAISTRAHSPLLNTADSL